MKKLKSKRYIHYKDLIRAGVDNVPKRMRAKLIKEEAERIADEKFIQENRLVLEINARNPA